jgi:hypothetical protein
MPAGKSKECCIKTTEKENPCRILTSGQKNPTASVWLPLHLFVAVAVRHYYFLMEEGMALGCQQYVNNTYWMRG